LRDPEAAQVVTRLIEAEMTAVNARLDALKQAHQMIQQKAAGT